MKRHTLIGIILFAFLTLLGCKTPTLPTTVNENLLSETWVSQVRVDPNRWVRHADSWYLTGTPNQIEQQVNAVPTSTVMSVSAPYFNNIEINGNVEVQLVGGQVKNSVYIIGSNTATRQIVTRISKGTLYINPVDLKGDYKNVIVRVGVGNIRQITNLGSARIWGRQLLSTNLILKNCSNGCIVINGQVKLTKVIQVGNGTVTVIGACSPALVIDVKGNGNVNVSGHVGLQKISHDGNGKVNVLGADSDSLTIHATCNGITTVVGCVNLKEVIAKDKSRVFVYWVKSKGAYVTASNTAQVGLAGLTTNLNVDLTGQSRYYGQYLHTGNLYVKTLNQSHANVTSGERLFAASGDSSSIYFYGAPRIISRYTSQNGVILPVWTNPPSFPTPPNTILYEQLQWNTTSRADWYK